MSSYFVKTFEPDGLILLSIFTNSSFSLSIEVNLLYILHFCFPIEFTFH